MPVFIVSDFDWQITQSWVRGVSEVSFRRPVQQRASLFVLPKLNPESELTIEFESSDDTTTKTISPTPQPPRPKTISSLLREQESEPTMNQPSVELGWDESRVPSATEGAEESQVYTQAPVTIMHSDDALKEMVPWLEMIGISDNTKQEAKHREAKMILQSIEDSMALAIKAIHGIAQQQYDMIKDNARAKMANTGAAESQDAEVVLDEALDRIKAVHSKTQACIAEICTFKVNVEKMK